MNRSVEQALTSLIPRYNGALPPELVDLASSLLAQSRTKASNLKAEEEIGRTYVCANIACERLKQGLDLPKIEPRPPCPPRIYNKLYTYFDTLLVIRKRGRPPKSASATSTPTKPLPSRPIPTSAASLAPYKRTPARASSARKRGLQYADTNREIAAWIHPMIRALCKDLAAPAAAPHILAGVTTVLTQPSPSSTTAKEAGKGEDKEDKKGKLPALIAAVYFFVTTRLSGKETNGREYKSHRKGILHALSTLRIDTVLNEKVERKVRGEGGWEEWEEVVPADVDGWLLEISSRGWLGLDWFGNIVEGGGLGIGDVEADEEEEEEDGQGGLDRGMVGEEVDEDESRDGSRTGLGTMMQDRVDYLSKKKREEYRIWKEGIMARVEEIEAQRQMH